MRPRLHKQLIHCGRPGATTHAIGPGKRQSSLLHVSLSDVWVGCFIECFSYFFWPPRCLHNVFWVPSCRIMALDDSSPFMFPLRRALSEKERSFELIAQFCRLCNFYDSKSGCSRCLSLPSLVFFSSAAKATMLVFKSGLLVVVA